MKIEKQYKRMTDWRHLVGKHEVEEEVFEVISPKGYSARYGTVAKTEGVISCTCPQWEKYDHCTHVDFVLGHPYMKGQQL